MNTTRLGMRTIVASAAAGALILGAAGGAIAAGTPKGPKSETPAVVWLKSVDIKRHSPLDISEANTDLKLKVTARVKDRMNALNATEPDASVQVTLALYDKKVRGTMIEGSEALGPFELAYNKGKKSEHYLNMNVLDGVDLGDYRTTVEARATAGSRTFLCLSTAMIETDVVVEAKDSKKVMKRLDDGEGNIKVGDCVKLVVKTPAEPESEPTPV